MRVLVTGGAGYIGTELVKKLAVNPHVSDVIVYDNLARKTYGLFFTSLTQSEKIHFVFGDILDTRTLKNLLNDIDVVYHLAARVTTPFAQDDPHMFEQINHWGTAELSYLIENSDIQKVIYTSSASVYGTTDEPVSETTIPKPATHYGISKLNGERKLKRLKNKNVLILRCGNAYGYGSCIRFDAVINQLMFEAHYFNRITIKGSGEQYRTFIHIDLITDVLAELCSHDLRSGIYNLTDRNLSINEIAGVLRRVYPKLETLYIEQDLQMRSLSISQNSVFNDLFPQKPVELEQQLIDFRSRFSF